MGEHVQDLPSQLRSGAAFRRERRNLVDLQNGIRVLEMCVFVFAGLAVAASLACSPLELPVESGLVATGVTGLVGLEVLRLGGPMRPGKPARPLRATARDVGIATAAATISLALEHTRPAALLSWDASFAVITGSALLALRAAFGELLRRMLARGQLAMNVAVFGQGPVARKTIGRLQACDPRLVAIVGRYTDQREAAPPGQRARGTSRILIADCRLRIVDAVVLAVEPTEQDEVLRVTRLLRPCVQDIYLAAELVEFAGPNSRPASLGPVPLLLVSERPLKGMRKLAKFAFDEAAALLLLILIAPLMAAIALAIKIESPGPVLFRQLRVGYNGRLFWILKFRSMHHRESDRLAKQQTIYNDPRVTRVGRLIRRTSIDELPQLINVLKGEMSLVGPRPHAPGTSIGGQRVHALLDDYDRRHLVRPGITGLAQVRGFRGGLHTMLQASNRLASDLEYIRRGSLRLDLKILILTFIGEIRSGKGF